ncbi:MAG TPA: urea ABC transporter permease subunit UrtC [Polyangiaceae bacterium]|nr:urea ABC transporter permease subunit UrtC [Polyangiaceae bacterium]
MSLLSSLRERTLDMQSGRQWIATAVFALVIAVAIPLLNATGAVPDYIVPLLGKFACYAMLALALDLVWGFAGILSLGHGLFFALGGYCMGMYLMRSIRGEGVYRSDLPDFMVFLDWKKLPWYWHGFENFHFALAMAILAPGAVALTFGYFAFRSRVKGVYLSIVTQALTYAAMLLFFQNATGFGGNNGLTDFKRILGYSLKEPSTKLTLYVVSAVALVATYLLGRYVVTSKLGRVLRAVRDGELKTRFCGYQTAHYKLFVWTLSAMLCGVTGALYVPQVGIINPSEMQPSNSVELAIWVAVGGRGTLVGPIVGAWLVNGIKSWLTTAFPSAWLFVQGTLFVVITLFAPQGLTGIAATVRERWKKGT